MTVRGDGDRSRRKSYDTFTPIGPWIVDDGTRSPIRTRSRCGSKSTGTCASSADRRPARRRRVAIISYASTVMRLDPGDVILTGAPPGVGEVHAGEVMVSAITGIGTMRNPVTQHGGGVMSDRPGFDGRLDAFYSDLGVGRPATALDPDEDPHARVPGARRVCRGSGRARRCARSPRARDLITIERGGERRVLALANPGLAGAPFATPTLWGAIQALGAARDRRPRTATRAAAIRFVLEGDGVWTTVDGDVCRHAPRRSGAHPGVDVPRPHERRRRADALVRRPRPAARSSTLDAIFYENHPDLSQPVRGFDLSEQQYAASGRLPYGDAAVRPALAAARVPLGATATRSSTSCSPRGRADGEHRVRRPDLGPPRAPDHDAARCTGSSRPAHRRRAARPAARSSSSIAARAAA